MGMYVQEIIDYIKRVSSYNLDEETIRSNLMTAGNSEQDIQSALDAVKREQKNLNNKVTAQNVQIITPATAFASGNSTTIPKTTPLPSPPINTANFTSYDTIRKSRESSVFLKTIFKGMCIVLALILFILIYNLYGKDGFESILEKVFLWIKELQK